MQDIKDILLVIKEWLMHLFDPHCEDCDHAKECRNCEHLRLLIEQERAEKGRILALMFEDRMVESEATEFKQQAPIKGFVPWSVRQRQLERKYRDLNSSNRRNKDNAIISDTGTGPE